MSRATSSARVTSATTPVHAPSAAAASSTRSRERAAITTAAPRRSSSCATARPIPVLAPVTTATFPSRPSAIARLPRSGAGERRAPVVLVRPRVDPVRLGLRQSADAARRERPGEHPARLDRHRGDLQHVLGRQRPARTGRGCRGRSPSAARRAGPRASRARRGRGVPARGPDRRRARRAAGARGPRSGPGRASRWRATRACREHRSASDRHGMGVADDVRAAELEADRVQHRLHRRAPPRARLDRRERLRHGGVVGRGVVQQRRQRRRLQLDEVRLPSRTPATPRWP